MPDEFYNKLDDVSPSQVIPFTYLENMWLLRYLLLPFSIIYFLVTNLRNHLFDIGYTKSFKFEVKVIGVGNLSTGGTGKSPMIEYLIGILKKKYKVCTLSRGYGRKTSGFILADDSHTSSLIGDEPRQFHLKFKGEINVSVGEDRVQAIPEILYHVPDTEVILLDDAFQHRYVNPGVNILLSDYKDVFYKDFPLPMGNLRESRKGAKRADILVITKCPDNISEERMQKIEEQCYKYVKKKTPVFFSTISYLAPVPVFENNNQVFSENIILFAGIGKSSYVEQHVASSYNLLDVLRFSDHHNYTKKDLERIKRIYDSSPLQDKCLLTTEKDMVKIKELNLDSSIRSLPVYYLPIKMDFIRQQEDFDQLIFKYLSDKEF